MPALAVRHHAGPPAAPKARWSGARRPCLSPAREPRWVQKGAEGGEGPAACDSAWTAIDTFVQHGQTGVGWGGVGGVCAKTHATTTATNSSLSSHMDAVCVAGGWPRWRALRFQLKQSPPRGGVPQPPQFEFRKHGRRTLPRPCRAPAASCCSCTRSCCVHLAYSSVGRRCVAGPLPPRRRLGPAGVVRLAPPAGPAFGPSHARRAPWQRAHPPAHPAALHAPPAVSCSFVCQCALCVLACGGYACRGGHGPGTAQ